MAILNLKRWEPSSYEAETGVFVRMKLKRLKRHEAKPLTRVLVKVFEQWEASKAADLTASQRAAIVSAVYEQIPEEDLKRWFSECVKDIEDFTIDDVPVTTGPELLENADDQLLFWLLFRLHHLSKLSSAESNASASPSGSSSTPAIAGGASPATSTDGEAGRQPSTAPATPTTLESSTGAA